MLPAFPKPGQIRKKQPAYFEYRDGRRVCNDKSKAGRELYKRILRLMWRRQKGICIICKNPGRPITSPEAAVFEHENGRGFNGSHRDDWPWRRVDGRLKPQNGAAHPDCNSWKASKRGYGKDRWKKEILCDWTEPHCTTNRESRPRLIGVSPLRTSEGSREEFLLSVLLSPSTEVEAGAVPDVQRWLCLCLRRGAHVSEGGDRYPFQGFREGEGRAADRR